MSLRQHERFSLLPRPASALVSLTLAVAAAASIASVAEARGIDRLTGSVAGSAIHPDPAFGTLPFTDATVGQSNGAVATGGGRITFDFSGVGLGVVAVSYRYTCLGAEGRVSTHRFIVLSSTNPALAPVGLTGLSSVIDATPPQADTDRVLLNAPPPPPAGACSREDRALLDGAPVFALTVTSGDWSVRDGLAGYP